MSKLTLSIAVGDYDRVRPLIDGSVQIDGVDPVFMTLEPEEIFFRAFRHADFDMCELSMSSFTVKTANGDCPYVGVPVFPSRSFRHNSIYVRTDRIKRPEDLKGAPYWRARVPGHGECLDARGAGGRVRREAIGCYLGPRRLRTAWSHREDRVASAAGCTRGGRTGNCDDFRHAVGRRDRCGDRAARPVVLRAASASRLAVS